MIGKLFVYFTTNAYDDTYKNEANEKLLLCLTAAVWKKETIVVWVRNDFVLEFSNEVILWIISMQIVFLQRD
jgi:hypothetical protein